MRPSSRKKSPRRSKSPAQRRKKYRASGSFRQLPEEVRKQILTNCTLPVRTKHIQVRETRVGAPLANDLGTVPTRAAMKQCILISDIPDYNPVVRAAFIAKRIPYAWIHTLNVSGQEYVYLLWTTLGIPPPETNPWTAAGNANADFPHKAVDLFSTFANVFIEDLLQPPDLHHVETNPPQTLTAATNMVFEGVGTATAFVINHQVVNCIDKWTRDNL